MIERVETLVMEVRQLLEITEYPQKGDLGRLIRRWRARFRVRRAPKSLCYFCGDRAVLVIDERLRGLDFERELAHELGHGLFCWGLADFVRAVDWRSLPRQRLACAVERKEEGIARQFALAWFLPAHLVLRDYSQPWKIERESQCPPEWVAQRRVELWGMATGKEPLPEWWQEVER